MKNGTLGHLITCDCDECTKLREEFDRKQRILAAKEKVVEAAINLADAHQRDCPYDLGDSECMCDLCKAVRELAKM